MCPFSLIPRSRPHTLIKYWEVAHTLFFHLSSEMWEFSHLTVVQRDANFCNSLSAAGGGERTCAPPPDSLGSVPEQEAVSKAVCLLTACFLTSEPSAQAARCEDFLILREASSSPLCRYSQDGRWAVRSRGSRVPDVSLSCTEHKKECLSHQIARGV